VLLKSEEKPAANGTLILNAALAHRSVISIVAIPIARSMEQLYRNNAIRKVTASANISSAVIRATPAEGFL